MDMSDKNIIQIIVGTGDTRLYALCDDGSLWRLTEVWKPVPNIKDQDLEIRMRLKEKENQKINNQQLRS